VQYIWSLVVTAVIVSLFFLYPLFKIGQFEPVMSAVGGLLFTIPIRLFWQSYLSPILQIKDNPEIRTVEIGFKQGKSYEWEENNHSYAVQNYVVNRIIVKNVGRSAAKNCKGYLVIDNSKERVCWTVGQERPNATVNPKDEERLDLCALRNATKTKSRFSKKTEESKIRRLAERSVMGGPPPKLIAPTEGGWPLLDGKIDPRESRNLPDIEQCEVLITAENAHLVKKRIKLDFDDCKIIIE
jgi:hypothetical protein